MIKIMKGNFDKINLKYVKYTKFDISKHKVV